MGYVYNLQIIGIICGLWVMYCIMGRIMSIIHRLLMLYCIVGSIIVYNPWIIPIICGLYPLSMDYMNLTIIRTNSSF